MHYAQAHCTCLDCADIVSDKRIKAFIHDHTADNNIMHGDDDRDDNTAP